MKPVRLIRDKMGHRQYTLASLLEKITDQYAAETGGRTDILGELDTYAKRLTAVREVADYVLATEYIDLHSEDKAFLIQEAVAELFYFGALDVHLRDESVTEITLDSIYAAHIRRGFNEMLEIESPFQNLPALEALLERILAAGGGILSTDAPFLEIGLNLHDRPTRFSYIGPPVNPMYSLEMRLHPRTPFHLDGMTAVPPQAREVLEEIVKGEAGLMVTGEANSGKTAFMAALLNDLIPSEGAVIVERAREMLLTAERPRFATQPPRPDFPGSTFPEQIRAGVEALPTEGLLVLDEIRGDEGASLWDALSAPKVGHLLMAFRGSNNPTRLLSAFGIALRKGYPQLETEAIERVLVDKMPFVAVMSRLRGEAMPRLSLLAQWESTPGGLTLAPLVVWNLNAEPIRTEVRVRV